MYKKNGAIIVIFEYKFILIVIEIDVILHMNNRC